jgi:predicted metalloprotease with PDZ domain
LIRPAQQDPVLLPRRLRATITPTLFALWALASAVLADETERIHHHLSFADRGNQYLHVESVWTAATGALELSIPSWTPGSYLIRDFAGQVEGVRARGASGRDLRVEKVAKNRWRIEADGSAEITVSYDVWAGELNVATPWVESAGALLNGAGIYFYSEASRWVPQEVTLELPADWSNVETSLEAVAGRRAWRAKNFDELVDSPIVAGTLERHGFRVRGRDYALVLPTGNTLWNAERSRDDVAQIVEAQQLFWDSDPFEREYLFLNLFQGPFGGLEHDHSTVMMADPWQMTERRDYIKWLGLVSHEFFHAWNVRRMRPSALAVYDYDQETYTRELWLAEGLSSYYDDLMLFRAELISVSEYFDLLAQEIRHYEVMPGRQVRSAEQASFDTWIKQYQPDTNSINSTVSYYRKGTVIGFVTDTAIRRETDNRASLDSVMREMYARYGPAGPGRGAYPSGAFEELVEEVAGTEVRNLVEQLLRETDDPDVDAALGWYGLSLDRAPVQTAAQEASDGRPGGLGVLWDASGQRLLADQVVLGRAGAVAGVLPGDELIAIDGFRLTTANYLDRIGRLRPGQRVELTLARHDRLLTLPVEVQPAIPNTYAIVIEEKLRRSEQRRLEAWLGRDLRFNQ